MVETIHLELPLFLRTSLHYRFFTTVWQSKDLKLPNKGKLESGTKACFRFGTAEKILARPQRMQNGSINCLFLLEQQNKSAAYHMCGPASRFKLPCDGKRVGGSSSESLVFVPSESSLELFDVFFFFFSFSGSTGKLCIA